LRMFVSSFPSPKSCSPYSEIEIWQNYTNPVYGTYIIFVCHLSHRSKYDLKPYNTLGTTGISIASITNIPDVRKLM